MAHSSFDSVSAPAMVWATDDAKAALDARYKVVVAGRNTERVVQAVGPSEDLVVVKLDVTKPSEAESAC